MGLGVTGFWIQKKLRIDTSDFGSCRCLFLLFFSEVTIGSFTLTNVYDSNEDKSMVSPIFVHYDSFNQQEFT